MSESKQHDVSLPPEELVGAEQAISRLVRQFYGKARKDDVLAPIFAAMVHDWEAHFIIVENFWSHALLGTTRYQGHPFPVHMQMPVEPAHFDRWLELFCQTAQETLSPSLAKKAVKRSQHMAHAFKVGLFPFILPNGEMSRTPAPRGASAS